MAPPTEQYFNLFAVVPEQFFKFQMIRSFLVYTLW